MASSASSHHSSRARRRVAYPASPCRPYPPPSPATAESSLVEGSCEASSSALYTEQMRLCPRATVRSTRSPYIPSMPAPASAAVRTPRALPRITASPPHSFPFASQNPKAKPTHSRYTPNPRIVFAPPPTCICTLAYRVLRSARSRAVHTFKFPESQRIVSQSSCLPMLCLIEWCCSVVGFL